MKHQRHRDIFLLHHINDAIAKIALHRASNARHETILSATIYERIVIGEAVSAISADTKQQNPHIPWQKIKDSRNKMVHDYEEVSATIVEDISVNRLPLLKQKIQTILSALEQPHG